MAFYVYILKCSDDSYYVGHTDDIDKRMSDHVNHRYCNYTSKRLPVKLVFLDSFQNRDSAFTWERRLKKWSRKKKEALIEGNWNKVQELSKKKFD